MVKDQAVRRYLADALCEALFAQSGPTRLWSLLQALPESLVCGPQLAVETLEGDARFVQCVTRWDLAHRATVSSRPFGGALEAILQSFGRPMTRASLVSELCLSRPGDPLQFAELLDHLLHSGRDVASFDGRVYLTKWLANTSVAGEQSQLFINGLSNDSVFLALRPKLMVAGLKQRHLLDTAEAMLQAAKAPVSNRGLGLLLHHHHKDRFSAPETLAAMCCDDRFLALSGPEWTLAAQEKAALKAIAKEGGSADEIAPPAIDLAALLLAPPAQKLKLDEAIQKRAHELVGCARTPVDLEELLTDLMALEPRKRNFIPAAHALHATLNTDLFLLHAGPGRYLSRQTLPPWVRTVPPALVPEAVPLAPREKSRDLLLPLAELAPGLAEHVVDPYYEDEGETGVTARDDVVTETSVPILLHHHRCGTMKLRRQDRRLYDQPGPISLVTFVTPQSRCLPIWLNQDTQLLYGFLTWYAEALPPCGALLTVQRDAADRDVYYLLYEGETDPGTYIGQERLAQLETLRDRLHRKRPFLVEVVTALLHGNTKGLSFDHLWSQVNVIRRTTRLLLASTLTAYEQFVEMSGKWRVV